MRLFIMVLFLNCVCRAFLDSSYKHNLGVCYYPRCPSNYYDISIINVSNKFTILKINIVVDSTYNNYDLLIIEIFNINGHRKWKIKLYINLLIYHFGNQLRYIDIYLYYTLFVWYFINLSCLLLCYGLAMILLLSFK